MAAHLEPLRERVEARARREDARLPHAGGRIRALRPQAPADPLDVGKIEAELPGNARGHARDIGAEHGPPGLLLLGGGGLRDVDRQRIAAELRPGIARLEEHESGDPREQPGHERQLPVGVLRVQVQRDRQHLTLALPQSRERLELAPARRQHVDAQPVDLEPQIVGGLLRDRAFAAGIDAEQVHHRQPLGTGLQLPHDPVRQLAVRRRQAAGVGQRREQRRQPIVEVVQPLEITDDTFVGSECAGGERERAGLIDVDEAPAAQRSRRRQRLPDGLVEEREGEGERRIRARRLALRCRAEPGRARVELHRRAQEQDLLLEFHETHSPAEDHERGRRIGGGGLRHDLGGLIDVGAADHRTRRQRQVHVLARALEPAARSRRRRRRLDGRRRRLLVLGQTRESQPQPRHRRREILGVRPLPGRGVVHVIVTLCASSKTSRGGGGVASRLNGRLSTPSTRSRTTAPVTTGASSTTNVNVVGGAVRVRPGLHDRRTPPSRAAPGGRVVCT